MLDLIVRGLLLFSTPYISAYILYLYGYWTTNLKMFFYSYEHLLIFLNIYDTAFVIMIAGIMFPYVLLYEYCERDEKVEYFGFGVSHLYYIAPVIYFMSPRYSVLEEIPPRILAMKDEFNNLEVSSTLVAIIFFTWVFNIIINIIFTKYSNIGKS